jgi:hypothetical protein
MSPLDLFSRRSKLSPPRAMKRPDFILLIALAAFSIHPPSARADDEASHRAAADELLQVIHSDTSLDRVRDQMTRSAERMSLPGANSATPPEVAAYRESVHQQTAEIIKDQLDWAKFEPEVAQLYVATFTEPELKTLIEFYKTPVGQKLVSTQTELAGKITVLTQQKVRMAFSVLSAKVRESSAKFRADHPAKVIPPLIAAPVATPVPPSPTLPSPSPTPAAVPASPAPKG